MRTSKLPIDRGFGPSATDWIFRIKGSRFGWCHVSRVAQCGSATAIVRVHEDALSIQESTRDLCTWPTQPIPRRGSAMKGSHDTDVATKELGAEMDQMTGLEAKQHKISRSVDHDLLRWVQKSETCS